MRSCRPASIGIGRWFDSPSPSRQILPQGGSDPLQRPVDLIGCDHQRCGDADGVVVVSLGKDALTLQRLASSDARRRLPGEARPPASVRAPRTSRMVLARRLLKPSRKRAPWTGCVLDHPFLDKHAQRRARHRTGERIAAEVEPCWRGFQRAEHRVCWKAPRHRINTRRTTPCRAASHPPRCRRAAPPAVCRSRRARSGFRRGSASRPCAVHSSRTARNSPRGGMMDAGFPLDRLDQEGNGVRPIAASSASASPKAMSLKPGANGPK